MNRFAFWVVCWLVALMVVGNILGLVTNLQYNQGIQYATYAIVLLLGFEHFSKKGTNQ